MTTGELFANFGVGVLGALRLFGLSLVLSLLFGIVLTVLRIAPVRLFRAVGTVYVTVMQNTPLVLVMFFCAFGLPYLAVKFSANAGVNSFIYAVIAISLYTSAFVCEVFRSGVATVPLGQSEAARSIGLGFGQTLGHVILPQAIRSVVAPLASVIITMLKSTSIASAFNCKEIIFAMNNAIEKRGDIVIPILVGTAVIYIVLNMLLGAVFTVIERKAAIVR